MSIAEDFIMFEELQELFKVKQTRRVLSCLQQNNIEYLMDYRQRPMVLRSNITNTRKAEDESIEEVALFT